VVTALRSSEEVAVDEAEGRKRPKYLRLGALGDRAEVVRSAPDTDSAPAFSLTVSELRALMADAVTMAVGAAVLAADRPVLLDREAIALALDCSGSTIDKLRRGGMPHIRLGDSPRFELDRCLEWLRKAGAA
jgi:hypothetical protein